MHSITLSRSSSLTLSLFLSLFRSCYSYVGRQGNGQTVSLSRSGCLYHNTVQHELLHALGFNHEQTRSDRDNHIRVLWENISEGYVLLFFILLKNMKISNEY